MDKIDEKTKTKTFLIGKELKTKDLRHTAELRASGGRSKPKTKALHSLRQGPNQAAGAAPTLRYGPTGDSPPRLRLKARLLTLCSLPRTNPGDRLQYKRVNGPYTLIMTATGEYKLPFGPLPRLLMA